MRNHSSNKQINIAALVVFILSLTSAIALSIEAQASKPKMSYTGFVAVQVNGNIPTFTEDEITTTSFETYGELDKYGRCTTAIACIGQDLMPTQERGSIGMVKPTGWSQNKYEGIVDSDPPYLFNRCHIIGFQLTGENENEKNLITGTRYMNVEGMLPYENKVASYIKDSGNHVMYRVTPVFEKENLVCSGVNIEALSVEDEGKGISFNVYCFNVQPGVIINYADGSNRLDPDYKPETTNKTTTETNEAVTRSIAEQPESTAPSVQSSYIANKNTKKFHYPSCDSVSDMKESNKLYFDGSRDELIGQGYVPCKRCTP